MERDEIEQMLDDTKNMVSNLMFVNLEVWMTKSIELDAVCRQADERGLLALHEDVAVRLMSALN